jgi:hypothetical protein
MDKKEVSNLDIQPLQLVLPVPAAPLNDNEPLWSPELLAHRAPERLQATPDDYIKQWLPKYQQLEEVEASDRPLMRTEPMFVWVSGATVQENVEYACSAYPFETIMALHACASHQWNASQKGGVTKQELAARVKMLQVAAGIYKYIETAELERWKCLPDNVPPECTRSFTSAMHELCLAQAQFLCAQLRAIMAAAAASDTEGMSSASPSILASSSSSSFSISWTTDELALSLYAGCMNLFLGAYSRFKQLQDTKTCATSCPIAPGYLDYALRMRDISCIHVSMGQAIATEQKTSNIALATTFLKQRMTIVSKFGHTYLQQQVQRCESLLSGNAFTSISPIVATDISFAMPKASAPRKFIAFEPFPQKRVEAVKSAIERLNELWNNGESWTANREAILALLRV